MKKLSLAIDSPAEGSSSGSHQMRGRIGVTRDFQNVDADDDYEDPIDEEDADLIDDANFKIESGNLLVGAGPSKKPMPGGRTAASNNILANA